MIPDPAVLSRHVRSVSRLFQTAVAAGAALSLCAAVPAQLKHPDTPLWEPIADEVYLQEIPQLFPTDSPLTAVAIHDGQVWAADHSGLLTADGNELIRRPGVSGAIRILKSMSGHLYAAGPSGLWCRQNGSWEQLTDRSVADFCLHDGRLVAAIDRQLFAVQDRQLTALNEPTARDATVLGVDSWSGTLYVHDGRRVGLLEGRRITYDGIADWGTLERGCVIRDIHAAGSRLFVATSEGLNVLRGATWYHIDGDDGLCYHDTTCLATGFDRDLWIGTNRGAIRRVRDEYQFFGYQRWIPHDSVTAVACGSGRVCLATRGGLSIIRYEPYTLAKKAAYYERWLREWGMKRLGFVHSLLLENGRWVREVSDNDVGYSSHYLAARCFEYAVTGSEQAREEAVDMMRSVKWSEEITPLDGFPARSIFAVGEDAHQSSTGSGGLPAEWHRTEDERWEWKGDTSSDEVDAQIYATVVFLNLAAREEDRDWAVDHLHRVVGHIVDNGFVLRDVDGKPTRWARWDPDYLQTPYGYYARGLNGMEAFSYLTTALHFTGDEKFARAKQFHRQQGYLSDILRQKITFPPQEFTIFDDRLAFFAYFPLIQYETDPSLKSVWRRSLERSWEIKRSEAVPWFHFLYGALTGNDCETQQAVEHLRGWPLDLRRWSWTNSHRDDLHMPPGYREYSERPRPLNPRETAPNRWDADFMRLDGPDGGRVVSDPGGWLEAYWMGRYYGMITAPQTDDPVLTTVPERNLSVGAAPYNGPPRPPLKHERPAD